MKKLALILALMLIPCTAFGLEMLTDNALDDVTGQAGVAIAADDIQIFLNVDRFAWIDSDGYGTSMAYGGDEETTIGGAIFIDNFQLDVLNINMIGAMGTALAAKTGELASMSGNQTAGWNAMSSSTAGVIPLFYDYANTNTMGALLTGSYAMAGSTLGMDNYFDINPDTSMSFATSLGASGFLAKPITIDATAALPLLSAGWQHNNSARYAASETIGGVIISFPTVEVYIDSMVVTPRFTAQVTANAGMPLARVFNEGQSYGTFEMQGITFSVLSGWMEIAPTGRPGDGY